MTVSVALCGLGGIRRVRGNWRRSTLATVVRPTTAGTQGSLELNTSAFLHAGPPYPEVRAVTQRNARASGEYHPMTRTCDTLGEVACLLTGFKPEDGRQPSQPACKHISQTEYPQCHRSLAHCATECRPSPALSLSPSYPFLHTAPVPY